MTGSTPPSRPTREELMERVAELERQLSEYLPHGEYIKLCDALTAERARAARDREMIAAWMVRRGFATGHGDTLEDLLRELAWQVEELRGAHLAALERKGQLKRTLRDVIDASESALGHYDDNCEECRSFEMAIAAAREVLGERPVLYAHNDPGKGPGYRTEERLCPVCHRTEADVGRTCAVGGCGLGLDA